MKWSYLPEEYFQGQPIGYKVIYHPAYTQSDINFVNVNNKLNTTTLTDLAEYTMYVIYVSAVSSGGVGSGQMTVARTGHNTS